LLKQNLMPQVSTQQAPVKTESVPMPEPKTQPAPASENNTEAKKTETVNGQTAETKSKSLFRADYHQRSESRTGEEIVC
jgi:hypothetical protein